MLNETLVQASQQHRKRMLWVMAALLLLSTLLVLLFLWAPISPSPDKESKAVVPVQSNQVQSDHAPSDQTRDEAVRSQFRELFMSRLQAYQNGLEAEVEAAHVKQWDATADVSLATQKQAAIEAFGQGEFFAALKSLDVLETIARTYLTTKDEQFSAAMTAAKLTFDEDDADKAALYITQALAVSPDDPQALALAKKIEVLPVLLGLLEKAAIARLENNPPKEYKLLTQAFQRAPLRDGLKERKDTLAEKIRQRAFAREISSGLAAVDQQDIQAAKRYQKRAKSLYSARPELLVLEQAIGRLSDTLALKHALKQSERAIAEDDWIRARTIYDKAVKRFPEHAGLREGLQLSAAMVRVQQAISSYLLKPERLASSNVFAMAQDTLIQARPLSGRSPMLADAIAALEHLLIQANEPVAVLVLSDHQTFILVRGVGKVGLTDARTIQLKPGAYIFEGRRAGYKSRLVRVKIPFGATSFKVEVVCNEPV